MSEIFSATLRNYRLVNKLTVQKMADKIGIPKRTYENWESGKGIPDKFKETAVLKLLGID